MSEEFHTHRLDNGLTLAAQRMARMGSASMSILAPAGAARDADDRAGAAAVLGEWLFRGAGPYDTRGLNDALDALGVRHGQGVRSRHLSLSFSMLRRNLPQALEIAAHILRRPRLTEAGFAPARELVRQDLDALADEPSRHAMVLMREQFFPYPLGRCVFGRVETLGAMTPDDPRDHYRRCAGPGGTVIAVAGAFEWDALRDAVETQFGDWQGPPPEPVETTGSDPELRHLPKPSAQEHIVLAVPAVTPSHEQYYAARLAETVMSGGMGSRLFTEVREKLGLVYHISMRYQTLLETAGMFIYAGTRPRQAARTFEVTLRELRRLGEGVTPDELERAKTQLRSSMVIQGQSTAARAGAVASDHLHLGRLRTLEEMNRAVQRVSGGEVAEYAQVQAAARPHVLAIGPEPLELPEEAAS